MIPAPFHGLYRAGEQQLQGVVGEDRRRGAVSKQPGDTITVTADTTVTAVWENVTEVTINGVTGSFNDKIKLNYYFTFPQSVLADKKAYVTLTGEGTGKDVTLPVEDAEFVRGKGFKFSLSLAAKEAGDTISAKVFNGARCTRSVLESPRASVTCPRPSRGRGQ